MVTIRSTKGESRITNAGEFVLMELGGLSTDSKPTTIEGKKVENASVYIAIDTGKVYLYNLTDEEWNEV